MFWGFTMSVFSGWGWKSRNQTIPRSTKGSSSKLTMGTYGLSGSDDLPTWRLGQSLGPVIHQSKSSNGQAKPARPPGADPSNGSTAVSWSRSPHHEAPGRWDEHWTAAGLKCQSCRFGHQWVSMPRWILPDHHSYLIHPHYTWTHLQRSTPSISYIYTCVNIMPLSR